MIKQLFANRIRFISLSMCLILILNISMFSQNSESKKQITNNIGDTKTIELLKEITISSPTVVEKATINFIGYKLKTSLKNDQKSIDIPPFFHDIYDNKKLDILKASEIQNTYCLFKMYPNSPDFDYIMAVENKKNIADKKYAAISIEGGKFAKVTIIKKGHTAVGAMVAYLIEKWIPENNFKLSNKPVFIQYDERFELEYQKFGCKGNEYLGKPIIDIFIGIE